MPRKVEGAAALTKGILVLNSIADSVEPLRFSQLLGVTKLPKATQHRILSALIAERLVRLDSKEKTYGLGFRLLEMARRVWEEFDVRQIAEPDLLKLRDGTGETVHLAILVDLDVVYIEKFESRQSVRTISSVGNRAPSYCTGVGKAILAFLKPDKQEEIIKRLTLTKFTENTISSRRQLLSALKQIKTLGYATDIDEHHVGIRCVAAPIFDFRREVVAGVSVTAPGFRFDLDKLSEIAPVIVETAQEISRKLGSGSP